MASQDHVRRLENQEHGGRVKLPPIPDLRFEQGYLKSLLPFVHKIESTPASNTIPFAIEWSDVAWVTVRDQMISPLAQGLVWGVTSYYLRPVLSFPTAFVRKHFNARFGHLGRSSRAALIGWWKNWSHGVTRKSTMS